MALDSGGLLQGGIAASGNIMRQRELDQKAQTDAANQQLYRLNLDRENAKLELDAQNQKFSQGATMLEYQLKQQKAVMDQNQFIQEYALKKATLATQREQFDKSLGVQVRGQDVTMRGQDIQAGLETRGQDITARGQDLSAGVQTRGQDIQQGQFQQSYGLQEQDSQYKQALLAFQKDPTNPDNLLKMSTIAKNTRDALSPLSTEGKLQVDVNNGIVPQSVVDAQRMKEANGRIPQGYRFSNPNDPNSKLEAIPGGPAEKLTPQNAAANAALGEAKRDLSTATSMLIDSNGSINRSLLASAAVGLPGSEGKQFNQTMQRAIMSKLRLESGAAISDQELQRYNQMFIPSIYDSEAAIKGKIKSLSNFLGNTTKFQEGYVPNKGTTSQYSETDLAYTAQKNNMTIDQVKQQLGV